MRKKNIGSRIVEADLDRSDVLFDIGKQLLNLSFLTGIDAERVSAVARGIQLVDQSPGLRRVTPADADGIAALGKTPGDGGADGVARADKDRSAATFDHRC